MLGELALALLQTLLVLLEVTALRGLLFHASDMRFAAANVRLPRRELELTRFHVLQAS